MVDRNPNQREERRRAIEPHSRAVRGRRAPAGREPTRPPTRPSWWPRWQAVARLGLAIGLVGFGTVVFLGVQERVDPVAARVIDRLDPDAVMEITGYDLVQTAGGQENFALKANRQLTYADGAVRFVDGVELAVAEQSDRESFVVTGAEARVDAAETDVTISGDVQLTVSDGLGVRTDVLVYATGQGLVTMHDDARPTTLTRSGLEASGRQVIYDRDRAVVMLREAATVRLIGDDDRAAVDIQSDRATLAHVDRYMHFTGGTEILTGPMVLESENATAHFGEEETALERLELRRQARIRSTEPTPGGLREMRATEMTLEFEKTARVLERAILAGASTIDLVGSDGARGARIDAATMDVTMAPDGGNVTELVAQDGVGLELPVTPSGSRQEIRAVMLTGTGTPVTGLTTVRFDQTVEYREQRAATPTSAAVSRVIRADRLVSDVEEGLSALVEAQFLGNVRFEDESRQATADMVVYDIAGGRVTLESVGDAGRVASVTDATSNIRAPRIELALDASSIAASGGVASVLMPGGTGDDGTADSTSGKMPGLLEQDQEVLVSADSLRYDGDGGQTTYTGQAHLWQGDTSFEGDTLAVDEHTGNLTATGQVRTSIQIVRLDETTQRREASLTRTEADAFVYDDAARRAVYDGEALLRSEHGDLKADRIEVFLEADGRTLDRFEATGNVKLRLDGRWATGEQLVYYEADGRYEMEGAPVEIVEEVAPEETATPVPLRPGATPPPPSCRSTTGRALTFYRSTETVSVDGREERRTESISGACTPLIF